jgi:hypothetical protein
MSEQSPAGVSKPPLTINDTDKRGVILVVSVVLLSFLLVSFLTRIWVRLRVSGPWSYDDTTLTVATVRLTCYTSDQADRPDRCSALPNP